MCSWYLFCTPLPYWSGLGMVWGQGYRAEISYMLITFRRQSDECRKFTSMNHLYINKRFRNMSNTFRLRKNPEENLKKQHVYLLWRKNVELWNLTGRKGDNHFPENRRVRPCKWWQFPWMKVARHVIWFFPSFSPKSTNFVACLLTIDSTKWNAQIKNKKRQGKTAICLHVELSLVSASCVELLYLPGLVSVDNLGKY